MTGIGWLDAAWVVAFAVVTGTAVLRIVRRHRCGLDRFADDGFHAVMGVAMTAMFWPGSSATAVWLAVIGMIVVWPLLVLGLAGRKPAPGPGESTTGPTTESVTESVTGPTGPRTGDTPAAGRLVLGRTGYWLVSGWLMVLAVGAGHGSAPGGGHTGPIARLGGAHPAATDPAGAGVGASGLGPALQTMAGWPIWAPVGVGLLLYAGWLGFGSRHSRLERACAAVMAAGTAGMAFSL